MRTSSWPSSETTVLSDAPEVDSVNVPATLPAFWMSTVPVALSPGFRFGAVRTALAAAPLPRLLSMLSVPAVKVLAGFAADAVKFAPDPTVMPTAARTTASAPRVRRGCATRACRRVTDSSRGRRIWRPVVPLTRARETGCLITRVGISGPLPKQGQEFGASEIPIPRSGDPQFWSGIRVSAGCFGLGSGSRRLPVHGPAEACALEHLE